MSRPIWDYPIEGRGDKRRFWADTALGTKRPDWTCNYRPTVFTVTGEIDPRIGLPTWFKSTWWEPYDVVVICSAENNPDQFGDTCMAGFDVFRVPDGDDIIVLSLDALNHIQILPDGGLVRWLRWPPDMMIGGWRTSVVDWIAWRIEYPDGRIVDLAPEVWYANEGNPQIGLIRAARGKNGTPVQQEDGSTLLVDGSGRPYMRLDGLGYSPWALAAGSDWRVIRHPRGFDQQSAMARNDYLWLQFGFRVDQGILDGLQAVYASRHLIRQWAPSEVLGVYYGLGQWEDSRAGRRHTPIYRAALFPDREGPIFAAWETELQRRIYDTRTDLWAVQMPDGSNRLGLLPWFLFPPLGGLPCYEEARRDWLTKSLTVASIVVSSMIPGWVGLLITVATSYAELKDAQKSLQAQMKALEDARVAQGLAANAAEGGAGIVGGYAAPQELLDRADGQETKTPAAGGSGLLLAVLAAVAATVISG
jgi:hypothetical protein